MSGQLLGNEPAPDPNVPDPGGAPDPSAVAPAMFGDDGNFNPEYLSHGELAEHKEQLSKFKTVGALAKSYAHLEKSKGMPKLAENASEADKLDYETKLNSYRENQGVPKDHTGYDLKLPEEMPEGVEMPEGAVEKYQQLAHKLGLAPDTAQQLMDEHIGIISEDNALMATQMEESKEKAVTDLKGKWGQKFDGNLEQAQNALNSLSGDTGISEEDLAPLMHNTAFIELMQSVGSKMGEGNFVKNGGGPPVQGGKAEALKVMNDSEHPDHAAFNNPNDPRHHEIMERVAVGLKR
jgi:hypothetical protein